MITRGWNFALQFHRSVCRCRCKTVDDLADRRLIFVVLLLLIHFDTRTVEHQHQRTFVSLRTGQNKYQSVTDNCQYTIDLRLFSFRIDLPTKQRLIWALVLWFLFYFFTRFVKFFFCRLTNFIGQYWQNPAITNRSTTRHFRERLFSREIYHPIGNFLLLTHYCTLLSLIGNSAGGNK